MDYVENEYIPVEEGEPVEEQPPVVELELVLSEQQLTDSYRWLIGAQAEGTGGAIRDMWMPRCFGLPGAVTDKEYWCENTDAGGVHVNSGVINHMYALVLLLFI